MTELPTTQNTNRPRRSDDVIIQQAAQHLAPKVKEWLNADTEISLIENVLRIAIRYDEDGYAIAKKLDGRYDPDSRLVEILDEASWAKSNALRLACIAWVAEGHVSEIPLETNVRWSKKFEAGIGIVTANHPDGKSTVMFPSLGHVREGIGSHGYVVDWEQLTLILS